MNVMERLASSVVVPVVVLERVEDAVPTAQALLAGGVDTMEITFRTPCAAQCIKAVADSCPDMLVGAGTVLNVEQAKLAVSMGARFIVSPGFDAGRTWSSDSLRRFAASMKTARLPLAFSCPMYSRSVFGRSEPSCASSLRKVLATMGSS